MVDFLLPSVTAVVGFIGGLAAPWSKQWSADWFSRRRIRAAINAEITPIVVSLNFYILKAIDAVPNERSVEIRCFDDNMYFGAFDYYWSQKRDEFLTLPEWSRLQNWYTSVRSLQQQEHPALFTAIMLFESLRMKPLDRCVDRGTKRTVRRTLDEQNVQDYKINYLLNTSGIRKNHS
jgi:hypothetical protein